MTDSGVASPHAESARSHGVRAHAFRPTTGRPSAPRTTVLLWGLLTAAGVAAGYAAVLLANARHYFTDDTESQYTALWAGLGRSLREGVFPVMVPEQWMAGNNMMDDSGLFNPPQLLIDVLAPSFDNVALYATLVKLVFSIIAALGVYRIALVYGARPPWAAVAGIAFPLSGWFLFFDQASWMTALTGTAWMVHAWASSVRYTRGQGGPIPVFVFLYLTITTQYIFPAIEAIVMLAAVAIGELLCRRPVPGVEEGAPDAGPEARRWWPVARLAAVSACAGLAGLIAFLPSILSADVTWRGAGDVVNDAFLTVPWSESLNASLPSALPAFTSWWGYIQPMPVTYIAWFVVPAAAFVDWRRAGTAWRELSAVGIFSAVMLMWAAGPGTIGALRWPARVLPMLALGVLVLVCVLIGRFGTLRPTRPRIAAGAVLIAVLLVRSAAADPAHAVRHLVWAVVIAVLGLGVVALARTRGAAAAAALTIVAMFPIAYAQVHTAQPTPMSWNLPAHRSTAQDAFPDFDGTTLQLGDRGLLRPEDKSIATGYASLVFGNYARGLDRDYVSGYTPTGYFYFGELLCMRWDGSVCPDAFRRSFAPEPTTGRPLVDLMNVDRVVLQRALFPDVSTATAPDGWRWVDLPDHDRYIRVLERVDGLASTRNGRVSHTDGVDARSIAETDTTSRVRVDSGSGGQVVFARLGWPGYRATLDGRTVPISVVAKSFVAIDVPPGTHDAELVLTWRPPGWKIGIASAVLGLLGLGVLQMLWYTSRRRSRPGAPTDRGDGPDRDTATARPGRRDRAGGADR